MPTEYKVTGLAQALSAPCDTKALTLDDLSALFKELYKKRPPPPEYLQHINWGLIAKHRIGFHYEGDLILMAPSELRRAKACGAIWYEDKNGNRLP